jgi:hypothetical protein
VLTFRRSYRAGLKRVILTEGLDFDKIQPSLADGAAVVAVFRDDLCDDIRQVATYAMHRCLNEGSEMPEAIELVHELKNFITF